MSRTAPAGLVAPAARGHQGSVPNALSLTFDDGPDPIWTQPTVRQLERCEARATFFMVGERVLAHPDVAREVLAAGHDVQLHCHRHIRHTELTERELRQDTESALAALRDVGASPRLWRAPWGVCTSSTRRIAKRLGLTLVRWAIDTHDWRGDTPEAMLRGARRGLCDGGSVLMHDGLGPGARRDGVENTIALIPLLVTAARCEGVPLAAMRDTCVLGAAA